MNLKNEIIKIDHHVYYDKTYYSLENFQKLFHKYNISKVVFSPPCTKFREPEKAEFMYRYQRKLLLNSLGYAVCKIVSKSFYNKKSELRGLWKLFSGKKNLIKILKPDNKFLYQEIRETENFKMWYWINPKYDSPEVSKKKIKSFRNKIFGVKFHQYWHNFELNEILKYRKIIKDYKLPVYLILGYDSANNVKKLIDSMKDIKLMFGYGAFPIFQPIWKIINDNKNCCIDLASNHIDNRIIKMIFEKISNEKIFFSSDCPYNFKNLDNEFDYNLFFQGLKYLEKNKLKYLLENVLS